MHNISLKHIQNAKAGNNEDIKIIFTAFKPSIAACATKIRSKYLDIDDAIQEGNIGLFKAILTYDDKKNASFVTYAKKCIVNNMLSAHTSHSSQKHKLLTNAQKLDDKILWKNPEADIIIKEQNKEFIQIAKKKLSSFEFLVFSLYTMQYPYSEIAHLTGKNEKSINNAIQRIHHKLRK